MGECRRVHRHDGVQLSAWQLTTTPRGNFDSRRDKRPTAVFDARVFIIPDLIEVENYFVWRQQDAERNSVMMLARAYASHKALAGKNRAAQHEIIHEAGDNWAKHPAGSSTVA